MRHLARLLALLAALALVPLGAPPLAPVAGPAPAERLRALLAADFNEAVCTPRRPAAWCAAGAPASASWCERASATPRGRRASAGTTQARAALAGPARARSVRLGTSITGRRRACRGDGNG